MKRLVFLLSVAWACNDAPLCAQVPNPGFENWTSGNPDGWFVTNVPGLYVTTSPSTDAHSGTKAAHGEVVTFASTLQSPLLQAGIDARGFPVSSAFPALELYYKFNPLGGDRLSVNVSAQANGNIVGAGAVAVSAATSNYTPVSVPMTYTIGTIPDTAIVQISIVGPSGADYHLGSQMWVDDIALANATGIQQATEAGPSIQLYPNPATQSAQVTLRARKGGTLEISDAMGQTRLRIPYQPDGGRATVEVPTASLTDGIYFATVRNDTEVSRCKFVVSH